MSSQEISQKTWIMQQTWKDLLFAHYPISPTILRPMIPSCFTLDTFEGTAWVSVVPFKMSKIRMRYLSKLPLTPDFAELNVRTYVKFGNKPGVYFFSLDANSKIAVKAGNQFYHLPYYDADMSINQIEEWVDFKSERIDPRVKSGLFTGKYRPNGEVFTAKPDTIEHWLTERYVLYVTNGKNVYEGNIHHNPWPLQPAYADIEVNSVAQSLGIPIEEPPAYLHYSNELKVVAWLLKKV
ncbi:DUF2071 domain-containing protein [Anaerobacillus alkaliphilus]|uniref:DUF2071 domain-containing protein n=1 Tax=Anaerobacillus alkaliphilus TaxID=1548597 RepID=A0A4Q0VMK3_9BACI|nr:DUF2071 domain-containing protein [Anaerobacillus alkaliphilus]RXI96264.1 DUF2071 domain-containing protein [Anaerobacillus alkaliphilus]